MDNRVFDINGSNKEDFCLAMKLAFRQCHGYGQEAKADYWSFDKKYGFIYHWYASDLEQKNGVHKLPTELTSEAAAELAWTWLQSDEAKTVELSSWHRNAKHDGSNSLGWRIYVEGWGHVGDHRGTVVAISPSYMWHGK